jgi:hypothetical protein
MPTQVSLLSLDGAQEFSVEGCWDAWTYGEEVPMSSGVAAAIHVWANDRADDSSGAGVHSRASTLRSRYTKASTLSCRPPERRPSRSLTSGSAPIACWSVVGTPSTAPSYQYMRRTGRSQALRPLAEPLYQVGLVNRNVALWRLLPHKTWRPRHQVPGVNEDAAAVHDDPLHQKDPNRG